MSLSPECRFVVREAAVALRAAENALVVGLSEGVGGAGQTLLFQVALSFDEQDRSLGMDTYSVTNASGATVYGGVTHCVLTGDLLTLRFDAASALALGSAAVCHLQLAVDAASVAALREGLRRVLTTGNSTPSQLTL